MRFWDVIKEISAQPVRHEANRIFLLALVGSPEQVAAARALLLGPGAGPEVEAAAAPYLYCASPPYSEAAEKRLRHADLILSLPGGPGVTEFRPADTLQVDRVEEIPERLLAYRPELRLALPRRFPGLRPLAAEQVIREVSRVNAEFAALSGISGAIPFLAPLFPAMVGTDILVLTKNQVMMTYRLAAVYGEDLAMKARLREALGIVAGAFGWRTVARELAALLPGGAGLPLRVGIAYSGTYAAGRAVQMMFDQGRRPTGREMRRISEEGARFAREALSRVRERLGRGNGALDEAGAPADVPALPDPQPALRAPAEAEERTRPE